MKKRANELEIDKRAMYAMPFHDAPGAMAAVPRRGVYRKGEKEKGGENVERCEEISSLRSRSSLIKLSQSLMHGASPWRGFRAPRRGAMT